MFTLITRHEQMQDLLKGSVVHCFSDHDGIWKHPRSGKYPLLLPLSLGDLWVGWPRATPAVLQPESTGSGCVGCWLSQGSNGSSFLPLPPDPCTPTLPLVSPAGWEQELEGEICMLLSPAEPSPHTVAPHEAECKSSSGAPPMPLSAWGNSGRGVQTHCCILSGSASAQTAYT